MMYLIQNRSCKFQPFLPGLLITELHGTEQDFILENTADRFDDFHGAAVGRKGVHPHPAAVRPAADMEHFGFFAVEHPVDRISVGGHSRNDFATSDARLPLL